MRFIAVIISLFLMLGYSHAQVSGSLSQGVAVNEVVIGAGAPTGAPAAGVKWYVDTTKNQATHFANGTVWQAVNASQDPEVIVGVASPTGTPPTGAKLYYNATLGRVTHVANAGAWAALPAWERKQAALTGGGVVTWVNKTLSFTQRFIAISFGRGVDNISTSGYYDINMPPVGTVIPGICGAPAQTVTAAGIPFSGGSQWHALYYKLPTGGSGSVASNFFFVGYVADCAIPENAILVAVENYDNNSLKLGTGEFIKPPTAPVFGASASAPLEGFYYPAAASYQGNGSFRHQTISTNIPANTLVMPTIELVGYDYGNASTVKVQIGLYNYSSPANSIYNAVWQCRSSTCPIAIRAGFDAASKLVLEVDWGSGLYFLRYGVNVYNDGNGTHQAAWFKGWSISQAAFPATITNIVTITQKNLYRTGFSVPMQNVAGALPKTSAAFTTQGGKLAVTVSGMAYRPSAGTIGISIALDGVTVGTMNAYTNEANSHKTLPTTTLYLPNIAAGSHTITLSAQAGTITDGNDYFNVSVQELP